MLNYKSKPKQVKKELSEEWDRAEYWFVKKMGGREKMTKLAAKMFQDSRRTKSDQCSEPVMWTSKGGNKWCMFLVIKYYKEVNFPFPHFMGFSYYETAASIGAFMPISTVSPNGSKGQGLTIHYTDHFFLRLADRAKIKANSPENIKGFIQFVYSSFVMINRDSNKEKSLHGNDADIVIKLPGSYGFGGINEEDGEAMFTVNTFILTSQLSSWKRKLVMKMDKFSELSNYAPEELYDIKIRKCIVKEDTETLRKETKRIWEMQKMMGVPEWFLKRIYDTTTLFSSLLIYTNIISKDDTLALYDFFNKTKNMINVICGSPHYEDADISDLAFAFRECVYAAGYLDKFNIKLAFKYLEVESRLMTEQDFEETWLRYPINNDRSYPTRLLDYDKDKSTLLTTK